MTTSDNKTAYNTKLAKAYDDMMETLHGWFIKLEHDSYPALKKGLEESSKVTQEINALSHEEAQLVSDYIKRDLEDAAHYMHHTKEDFKAWLQFDIEQVEKSLLDIFQFMADKTQEELTHLEINANTWKTGEITGIGSLVCTQCGKTLHFHKTGHIPPCPYCANTVFKRKT